MSKELWTIGAKSLRDQLPDDDSIQVCFGNGNLEFYRTKMRGEKLLQIEFNQSTDLVSDAKWIAVEHEMPTPDEIVAIICRQGDGGLLIMTGFFDGTSWGIVGKRPELRIEDISHWSYLPQSIPDCLQGDPTL